MAQMVERALSNHKVPGYTPLYEKGIKEIENKSMETTDDQGFWYFRCNSRF